MNDAYIVWINRETSDWIRIFHFPNRLNRTNHDFIAFYGALDKQWVIHQSAVRWKYEEVIIDNTNFFWKPLEISEAQFEQWVADNFHQLL